MVRPADRAGTAPARGFALFLALITLSSLSAAVGPPAATAVAAAATVNAEVNLRAGPGEEYEVLAVIPAGAGVSVDGAAVNGYSPVSFNGVSGWVAAGYLIVDGGAAPGAKDASLGTSITTDAAAPPPAAPPPSEEPAVDPGAGAEPRRTENGSYTERQIIGIIHEAADAHGQPREDMVRVARCESALNPNAVDPAGLYYGLFQFVPSTFAGTPYGQHDIFDPWANANAAAWMWSEGRKYEWVCQ